MRHLLSLLLTTLVCMPVSAQLEPRQLVEKAMEHWRGVSSFTELTMVIHRPDWERSMSMRAWTKGQKQSLVRIIAPKKDRGNGTLIDDNNMWSYSPKVNRVIKIPSSMMSQSWMGSDFSNKDIAKADDIVDQYVHSLLSSTEIDGVEVYEVEAIPNEDAAVVWGREVMLISAEHVVLKHSFYDQDDELVQELTTLEIVEMGGRTVASRQRMGEVDSPEEWTEISVDSIEYGVDISDSLFTLSNLRNPRD
jgi:outer membrane lipoprotein-sorting protein